MTNITAPPEEDSGPSVPCPACNTRGFTLSNPNELPQCDMCRGEGYLPEDFCYTCSNHGGWEENCGDWTDCPDCKDKTMTTNTETQAPLSDEEIEELKQVSTQQIGMIQFACLMKKTGCDVISKEQAEHMVTTALKLSAKVPRLLDSIAAANQRIRELELAAEWKPTHRHRNTGKVIRVIGEAGGYVMFELEDKKTAMYTFQEIEVFFEPLPEPEGEKAPVCP